MANERKVAITTATALGKGAVCYQTTLDSHRIKHAEPFTVEDVIESLARPDVVARSGHELAEHEERYLYYKEKQFKDAPTMMKTVVDHSSEPGIVTSMFRTSKFTHDGAIVYTREGYLEDKLGEKMR